jgi:hypothetical protein
MDLPDGIKAAAVERKGRHKTCKNQPTFFSFLYSFFFLSFVRSFFLSCSVEVNDRIASGAKNGAF